MATTPAMAARLEKAAIDNGFDQGLPPVAGWVAFASTHARLAIWLSVSADGFPVAAFSRLDVADALIEHGAIAEVSLPARAEGRMTGANHEAIDQAERLDQDGFLQDEQETM